MSTTPVDVIIPCRNEEATIAAVIAGLPPGFRALVVDNGSTDGTGRIARAAGARVVTESVAGYGAAVHAGVTAAESEVVCTMDGDGSCDPRDLPAVLAALTGPVRLALGDRRAEPGAWPVHARLGSRAVAARLRHRHRIDVHDVGPIRACRRSDLLALGVTDRGFGYPVELLARAGRAGWIVAERPVVFRPRAGGASKVSGTVRGSWLAARAFAAAAR